MPWSSNIPRRLFAAGLFLLGAAHAAMAAGNGDIVLSFLKGDTREGSKVELRIRGDSVEYNRTVYSPGASPARDSRRVYLGIQRRRTLAEVMGELPRYPAFGSCFGAGMRYYLVETDKGRFYRSLPESAGKCYPDEPSVFSLFEDLDDLLAPPAEREAGAPAS